MTAAQYVKFRDPLELFLDDGLSNPETAAQLCAGGYVVHLFEERFGTQANPQKRIQGIKDPSVIQVCHARSWLLITTDKEMRKTHIEEILRYQNIAILATAHNGQIMLEEWMRAIVIAKAKIERNWVKHPRPWCSQITKQGEISFCKQLTEADKEGHHKRA